MEIKFRKSAVQFLRKLDEATTNRVREKILILTNAIEQEGEIPFQTLDIKKLKGKWIGFFRIRVGDIRIIFQCDREEQQILIYDIQFRGDVYKK
ncbi:MAG: type II toxin-antitoxin system RelE/ParE family toxin [Spirulina sp.]